MTWLLRRLNDARLHWTHFGLTEWIWTTDQKTLVSWQDLQQIRREVAGLRRFVDASAAAGRTSRAVQSEAQRRADAVLARLDRVAS